MRQGPVITVECEGGTVGALILTHCRERVLTLVVVVVVLLTMMVMITIIQKSVIDSSGKKSSETLKLR